MPIFNKIKKSDTESTRQWDRLVRQLADGNVIPVIGPEWLVDDVRGTNPHRILIDDLAEAYELKSHPTTFSELLYDKDFPAADRKNIYAMLGEAFAQPLFTPSKLLRRLLTTRRFPFVITTSFTPVVEQAMREVWGNELRVMNFSNDPSNNDDIKKRAEIGCPTVYYMMGKVCASERKYVVTDYDMLCFCKAWLSSVERPQNLTAELQDKYLLLLGNNYGDWLSRFVWFALKQRLETQPVGLVVDPQADESLMQFMRRIDAFVQSRPDEVIDKMEQLLAEHESGQQDNRFGKPLQQTDVFISYSRADAAVAAKLYDQLTARGLKVWFDRDSLGYGADFMSDIIAGIRSTKFFVPIMTRNIEAQKNEFHPYRKEWQTAIDRATGYGRRFIFPVSEEGFDFYGSGVPDALRAYNAFFYQPEAPDFGALADEIQRQLYNI
jgi:hypothetical protein